MAIMRMPAVLGGRQLSPRDAVAQPPGAPSDSSAPVSAAAPPAEQTDVSARPLIAFGSPIAVAVAWAVLVSTHGFHPSALPEALKVSGDASTFALLYVAAQAIERALEPFSNLFLRTDRIKRELDRAVATAITSTTQPDGEAAAKKQDELDKRRGERALVLWAVATILGMGASAGTGLYFVSAILARGSHFSLPLDVLVTGLVIGGGSKPLHDLIARVEKSKEQTQDPAETNPKK